MGRPDFVLTKKDHLSLRGAKSPWLPHGYSCGYLKSYFFNTYSDLRLYVWVTWLPLYVRLHTRVCVRRRRGGFIFQNGVTVGRNVNVLG
jgi:hypothetical protein